MVANIYKGAKHFMIVPINDAGIHEMKYWFDDFTKNMYVQQLTHEEAESITNSVFNKFFEEFKVPIDYSEEEDLKNEFIPRAIEIVQEANRNAKSEIEKSASEKVLLVLQKAQECRTYVEFKF